MNLPGSRAARPPVAPSTCYAPATSLTTQALSSDADAAPALLAPHVEEMLENDAAQIMAVVRSGSGAVVQWHGESRGVRVTPSDALLGGGWVPAARLCAMGQADTVQVTLLRPELRAYVDGQRLLRLESPVPVRACQRLCFGADRGASVAELRFSPPHRAAVHTSPPPLATPPPAHEGYWVVVTPARAAALTHVHFTPLSSHLSSCQETPLHHEAAGAALRAVAATGGGGISTATAVPGRRPRPHLVPGASPPPTNAVREVALVHPSSEDTDCTSVQPTGEKYSISAVLSDPTSSDLVVEGSAAAARHAADVVDTAAAGGEVADALTRTAPRPPPLPERSTSTAFSSSVWSPSASARDATALLERRRDEVLRDILCGAGPPQPPHLTLGPVTAVRSPDWTALAAADVGAGLVRPSRLYQSMCDSTTFHSALAAIHRAHTGKVASAPRAAQSRGPRAPPKARATRASTSSAARTPPSGCSFSLDFSDRASIAAGQYGAASSGRPSLSFGSSSGGEALGMSFGAPADAATTGAAKTRRRCEHDRVKLGLLPRVPVEPYVVEAFGATHRYRPLARVAELELATTDSAAVAPSRTLLSAQAPQRRLRVGHGTAPSDGGVPTSSADKSTSGPWRYPSAADELVSPRTEALMRGALRLRVEPSGAMADAEFVHCVLRRSYDNATDRFTYIGSPEVADLLLTRVGSVLAALADRLRTSRPVLRVSAPVVCGGDLLGSFSDALTLFGNAAFFEHWSALHTPVLLLGNYVDFGWHSVEVCMLLCSWACLQPDMVHLLRGPHEDPAVNGCYRLLGKRCLRYKCRQRFGAARGVALWSQLNAVFALLPVAAIIDNSIFVAHGGVPLLHRSPADKGEGGSDRLRRCTAGPTPRRRGVYSGTSESATPTMSASASPSSHCASCPVPHGAAAGEHGVYADESDSSASSVVRVLPRARADGDAAAEVERVDTATTSYTTSDVHHHHHDSADASGGAPTNESSATSPTPPCSSTNGTTTMRTPQSPEVRPGESCTRPYADAAAATTEAPQAACAAAPGAATSRLASGLRDSRQRSSSRTSAIAHSPASPRRTRCSQSSCGRGGSASERSAFTCSRPREEVERDDVSWASISAPVSEATRSLWTVDVEATPSEDDFAALLAANTMQAHAFASLVANDGGKRSGADDAARQRQQRLVRELLWNRPRDVAAALLPVEESSVEASGAGSDLWSVPWWRPHVVACCTEDECCNNGVHRCCRIFGAGALLRFLRRFAFALLLRGAPEDTADFCGAALCEEGRVLSLSSCARQGRQVRQAAACVVDLATTVRLATWGSQELADSLGQLSLSSLPGVREAERERADFEQFVCDTLQARLREHRVVGPDNQWGVASAYEAFRQHCGEAGSKGEAVVHPARRRRR